MGKSVYDGLFRISVLAAVGDIVILVGSGIVGSRLISPSYCLGDRNRGLCSDSMLITLPFSASIKPARLSVRPSSSAFGVLDPDTEAFK